MSRILAVFSRFFRRGAWSPDENDQLDLDQVRGVAIGMHGTSREAEATGHIMAASVMFVPLRFVTLPPLTP